MNHRREILVLCSGLFAVTTLAACAGGGGATAPTASGRLDDTKHVRGSAAKTTTATRTVPTYTTQCKTTKVGKSSSTRCNKVQTGTRTETYTKVLKPSKPAKWCVELDRVNGRDDVWFRVTADTFNKWHGQREGKKVRRMPYLSEGC